LIKATLYQCKPVREDTITEKALKKNNTKMFMKAMHNCSIQDSGFSSFNHVMISFFFNVSVIRLF